MVSFFIYRLQSLAHKNVTDDVAMTDETPIVYENLVDDLSSSSNASASCKTVQLLNFCLSAKIFKIVFDNVQYSVIILLKLL